MTPEGRIKKKFSVGLKAIQERHPGKLMVRMPVSRGMGLPLLDYLLCANGRFILVEAKRDAKHEPTAQQKATRRETLDAGGYVWLVYDEQTIRVTLLAIETLLDAPPLRHCLET